MDEHEKTFTLNGRVALVTGSARGIGWGIARGMAQAGAHVVLNDLDPAALEPRLEELRAAGLDGSACAFDVTDEAAVAAGVGSIVAGQGRIDILVNNAGIQKRKRFVDFSYDEWRAVIDTHLHGAFLMTRAAIPNMAANRFGRIIMIGSVAVQSPKAEIPAYAAAKGGVTSLVRALAIEVAPLGITCNAIAPGYIATEFTRVLHTDERFTAKLMERVPAGRWGRPDDLAAAAVYLASAGGEFVNGSVLTVDGGFLACG
jgi:gluconate 5-dehydrogenase